MTVEAYATLAILIGLFGFLINTKLPPAAIFVGALTLVITFRLAPLEECLRGFSNSGMLTIGALFMVAAGMYTTDAIGMVSEKLIDLPKTLLGCQLKMLPPVAVGSAFLNNTPIVAMMIPIIRDLSRTAGLSAKRLYIPLSFASILGGACTLIGTATNLYVSRYGLRSACSQRSVRTGHACHSDVRHGLGGSAGDDSWTCLHDAFREMAAAE
jgi:Na+/H+ antiporter NhaD/arsenite permease-like protein